jgi:2-succinyl-5-enolpyruvyl-6-hydroxy-3-cyclohexene-1-carboxylate synthase
MTSSTQVARAVLGELVHQGVREVVLAPGSRSAPLAFEALRLERAGQIRLHVRVDERSAGFLALGLAKVGGDPVAVMCTSGTAVANLTPAVVEASYSAVPLVVVTADRPPESRGVGAPQTIDQHDFFGQNVRSFAEIAAPRHAGPQDDAELAARAAVGIAVSAALGSHQPALTGAGSQHAGPVHLNVGFRLPLVPDDAANDEVVGRGPAGSPPRSRRTPLSGCDTRDLREVLGSAPAHGVLLVGDLPPSSLRGHHQWLAELAAACGWPIIAEPTANLHWASTTIAHAPLVLGSVEFTDAHVPELVLSAGLFGLSRPTLELLLRSQRHVALELANVGREVCDPVRTAGTVLESIPLPPANPEVDASWLAAWQEASRLAADAVGLALQGTFSAGQAVAEVWRLAPSDSLLLVAASWPVRQLEAFAGRRSGVRVVGNRGANGIDGLVATAWGAALAHQAADGGPALALLGDLAFLHDHNSLLVGRDDPVPDLVLVVLDNDGGGIFHQLEQGQPEFAADFERLFGTPLGRDLVAVAEAAGVPALRVHSGAELQGEVRRAISAGGVHVVVAHVPDRQAEAALFREVRSAVAGRLFPTA